MHDVPQGPNARPRRSRPEQSYRLVGRLLPGAAFILDTVSFAAELTGQENLAQYARYGATVLRAVAFGTRSCGPAQQ